MPGALARAVAIADYEDVDSEWPDHVKTCHREVWHLTLWHQMFTELNMYFMQDYVVLAHDIREKADLLGRSTNNWRPRLPIIVRVCAAWHVHAFSVVWRTDSLEECIYLWAWMVVRFFDARNETDASLHQILERAGLNFY